MTSNNILYYYTFSRFLAFVYAEITIIIITIICYLTARCFRLTQNNPDLLDVTDPESLYTSHFNPRHPVKIIIHGFQGGRNLSPSTDLRNGKPTITAMRLFGRL